MKQSLKINPEMRELLNKSKIPVEDGLLYLLGIHFGIKPSFRFPDGIDIRISAAKIITLDEKTKTLNWAIPLFEGMDTNFAWVSDWIKLFGDVNKERRGNLADVTSRMKNFFATHPWVRAHEVMEATKMYIATVTNPTMLKTSHKFIAEGVGKEKYSHLLEWVEKYQEANKDTDGKSLSPHTLTTRMQ